jgi:hypothetical protein
VPSHYTERLTETGTEPSVGSVGGSNDNALANSVFGLYKIGLSCRGGPWRHLEAVEFGTREWANGSTPAGSSGRSEVCRPRGSKRHTIIT